VRAVRWKSPEALTGAVGSVPPILSRLPDGALEGSSTTVSQRGKCNKRRTHLRDLSVEELVRRSKDPSLPVNERRAYASEAKTRLKRNKQKRKSS
jgi:hypothetical protein